MTTEKLHYCWTTAAAKFAVFFLHDMKFNDLDTNEAEESFNYKLLLIIFTILSFVCALISFIGHF